MLNIITDALESEKDIVIIEDSKMAGGGFAVEDPVADVETKITLSVIISCIVAASSGLIFGYDIGISGSC